MHEYVEIYFSVNSPPSYTSRYYLPSTIRTACCFKDRWMIFWRPSVIIITTTIWYLHKIHDTGCPAIHGSPNSKCKDNGVRHTFIWVFFLKNHLKTTLYFGIHITLWCACVCVRTPMLHYLHSAIVYTYVVFFNLSSFTTKKKKK